MVVLFQMTVEFGANVTGATAADLSHQILARGWTAVDSKPSSGLAATFGRAFEDQAEAMAEIDEIRDELLHEHAATITFRSVAPRGGLGE